MVIKKTSATTSSPSPKSTKSQQKVDQAEQKAALLRLMQREGEKSRYAKLLCTDLYLEGVQNFV